MGKIIKNRKVSAGGKSPLLEFKNITVLKNGNRKILDSLSIRIDRGENVAILGPNGAGKSSFIKTITREYYPIRSGSDFSFKVLGRERWNIFDLRFFLGIVSNDLQYVFTRGITGWEVVLSGFFSSVGLYNERVTARMRKKAEEIIDFLEIARLKNRKVNEMSSGEARRFLIGRALVHEPEALILDEPANSLDLHSHYKFNNILRKITGTGVSVVLVTQNLYDIIPEINRVVFMREGRFVKDAPKEEILSDANIAELFGVPVEVKKKNGYYYTLIA